jgi:hypothetical protein
MNGLAKSEASTSLEARAVFAMCGKFNRIQIRFLVPLLLRIF